MWISDMSLEMANTEAFSGQIDEAVENLDRLIASTDRMSELSEAAQEAAKQLAGAKVRARAHARRRALVQEQLCVETESCSSSWMSKADGFVGSVFLAAVARTGYP